MMLSTFRKSEIADIDNGKFCKNQLLECIKCKITCKIMDFRHHKCFSEVIFKLLLDQNKKLIQENTFLKTPKIEEYSQKSFKSHNTVSKLPVIPPCDISKIPSTPLL